MNKRTLDFLRVATLVPGVKPGDVTGNGSALEEGIRKAAKEGAGVILTPELSLTGYTCSDLFFSNHPDTGSPA
jgi:NAD+ synthase (glutamine-hydrolysing)